MNIIKLFQGSMNLIDLFLGSNEYDQIISESIEFN